MSGHWDIEMEFEMCKQIMDEYGMGGWMNGSMNQSKGVGHPNELT